MNTAANKSRPSPTDQSPYDVLMSASPEPDRLDGRYVKHSEHPLGLEVRDGVYSSLRRVVVSGVTLDFDTADRFGLLKLYNGQNDIKEMFIVADEINISKPIRLPQTQVFIFCRALVFRGDDAAIDTSPLTVPDDERFREVGQRDGRPGLDAGSISVFAASVDTGDRLRFIARGGPGQSAEEGDLGPAPERHDVPAITEEMWVATFGGLKVWHEAATQIGPSLYESSIPYSELDWNKISPQCRPGQITYAEFKNSYYVDAFHSGTHEEVVRQIGVPVLPGRGGAGLPPGQPGVGGRGGRLVSITPIPAVAYDLTGGVSAPRHPGTPGGPGGSPSCAFWVLFRSWPDGSRHRLTHSIQKHEAVQGAASGPGPEAVRPSGEAGCHETAGFSQWAVPLLLGTMLQYARDCAATGHQDVARMALKSYLAGGVASADSKPPLPAGETELERLALFDSVVGNAEAMSALTKELDSLNTRLALRLDDFGNPPGWVPNLSLESMVGAYKAIKSVSLRELFAAYYLEKMWNQRARRTDALGQLIDLLVQQTTKLRGQMIDARNAIVQRGYVAPSDPTTARPAWIAVLDSDSQGADTAQSGASPNMSLLERLKSIMSQIEALEVKRRSIETRLMDEAGKAALEQEQMEGIKAGLKISAILLKSVPLPPPYDLAAGAASGVFDAAGELVVGNVDKGFDTLSSSMKSFTKDNADGLAKAFVSGIDEEVSANNAEIEELKKQAGAVADAKDVLDAAFATQKGTVEKATSLAGRALLAARQQKRQAGPDSSLPPRNFNDEIRRKAVELDAQRNARQYAAEYQAEKAKLEKQAKDSGVKLKQFEGRNKELAKAKARRAESVKTNIARANAMVDGIAKIGQAVHALSISESQFRTTWAAALDRIKSRDKEFLQWTREVEYLNLQKAAVVAQITQLACKLTALRDELTRKLLAIDALRGQLAKSAAESPDQGALVFIQTMRDDATRRLKMYLYLVTKAYEYYTVKPWKGDSGDAQRVFDSLSTVLNQPPIDLQGCFESRSDPDVDARAMADELKKLITAPSSPSLSSREEELLGNVYEKPLRDMGIQLHESLVSGRGQVLTESPILVRLLAADLVELNTRISAGHQPKMLINFVRLGCVPGTDEQQRIVNIRLMAMTVEQVGASLPSSATVKVTHVGASIVRVGGRFFAFEPQTGNGAGALAGSADASGFGNRSATYESSVNFTNIAKENGGVVLATSKEMAPQPKRSQETLISKLLGSSEVSLAGFRPGLHSDYLLTLETTPSNAKFKVLKLDFEITVEKGNATTDSALVAVFCEPNLPVSINVGRADLSGRRSGIGRYMGVFSASGLEARPLEVSVPASFGGFVHVGWSGGAGADAGPGPVTVEAGCTWIARYVSNERSA